LRLEFLPHSNFSYRSKMVNPGVFHGLRKDFLTREKVTYSNAVAGGYEKDTIADIQRRFFKRFPVGLPLKEELSAEHLASVNDADADPDAEEPDETDLTPEECANARSKLEERAKLIILRKGVRTSNCLIMLVI
jgi:hypothetical protein